MSHTTEPCVLRRFGGGPSALPVVLLHVKEESESPSDEKKKGEEKDDGDWEEVLLAQVPG